MIWRMQFCILTSRCPCVFIECKRTHSVCSRDQSSRGCTCTPHHRGCTGLRCDSCTSWDSQGPSAQRDRLQMSETEWSSWSHTLSHNYPVSDMHAACEALDVCTTKAKISSVWFDSIIPATLWPFLHFTHNQFWLLPSTYSWHYEQTWVPCWICIRGRVICNLSTMNVHTHRCAHTHTRHSILPWHGSSKFR